jgi:hypothetical protein
MMAIPNYARMNRTGPPAEYLADTNVNDAPGTTSATGNAGTATVAGNRRDGYGLLVDSKVWI